MLNPMELHTWVAQVRKGLVEMCVMGTLRQGEAYGYQILQALQRVRGLAITESTVYPILSRLTREGWLEVRVAASPAGPPRRYYRLTPSGEARLAEMIDYWQEIEKSTNDLLEGGRP